MSTARNRVSKHTLAFAVGFPNDPAMLNVVSAWPEKLRERAEQFLERLAQRLLDGTVNAEVVDGCENFHDAVTYWLDIRDEVDYGDPVGMEARFREHVSNALRLVGIPVTP